MARAAPHKSAPARPFSGGQFQLSNELPRGPACQMAPGSRGGPGCMLIPRFRFAAATFRARGRPIGMKGSPRAVLIAFGGGTGEEGFFAGSLLCRKLCRARLSGAARAESRVKPGACGVLLSLR